MKFLTKEQYLKKKKKIQLEVMNEEYTEVREEFKKLAKAINKMEEQYFLPNFSKLDIDVIERDICKAYPYLEFTFERIQPHHWPMSPYYKVTWKLREEN